MFASFWKSGPRNTIVTSDLRAEVEIRPFRACVIHPAIIIGIIVNLAMGQIPLNVFLVYL